jgi:hypothetical protein
MPMAALRLVETVAHAGKTVSEDLFQHTARAVWILDGATGIGPSVIEGAPSDPYWLVHAANDALKAIWDDEAPTETLCARAAEQVIAAFAGVVRQPPPPPIDRPTACLLIARLWRDRLELSTVGDCWLIHAGAHGVSDFGAKIDDAVAAPVRDALARFKAAGVSHADLLELLLPFEREVRAKANADGGYGIVDLTTRWPTRMQQRLVEVSPGDRLLLMTDGLYRLIDTFAAYDAPSLMAAAETRGLAALYAELRTLEHGDPDCAAYPRGKVSDDVAAALLTVDG